MKEMEYINACHLAVLRSILGQCQTVTPSLLPDGCAGEFFEAMSLLNGIVNRVDESINIQDEPMTDSQPARGSCQHFLVRIMGNAGPSGFETTHAECKACWKRMTLEEALSVPKPEEPVAGGGGVTDAMVDEAMNAHQLLDNGREQRETFYTYKRKLMRAALVAALQVKP